MMWLLQLLRTFLRRRQPDPWEGLTPVERARRDEARARAGAVARHEAMTADRVAALEAQAQDDQSGVCCGHRPSGAWCHRCGSFMFAGRGSAPDARPAATPVAPSLTGRGGPTVSVGAHGEGASAGA